MMRKTMRRTLFWDVNVEKLDFEKNARFIIGRVLDFGNLDEWKKIRDFYGLARIKKEAKRHVFSDRRSANFWALILNIPLNELKCTKRPSLKTPKAFLKR